MKRHRLFFVLCALLLLSTPTLWADYPPPGWSDNFAEAALRAQEEGKMIILDFTGSDWCGWCIRLEEEIWSTTTFQSWADDNAVLVYLDFPSAIPQDQSTVAQNRSLQKYFSIQGYPTVVLLEPDLTPVLRTGYRGDGPEDYIRHLESDRSGFSANEAATIRGMLELRL